MINTLDEVVKAGEAPTSNFAPAPKGDYNLRLIEVGDWEPFEMKNVNVISYNDSMQRVMGEDGKPETTLVPKLTVHNANLKFAIVGGDHDGKFVWHRVTTHPNMPWVVPSLLSGLGVPTLKLSQLKTLVDKDCRASLDIESYEKKKTVTDKDTGAETVEVSVRSKNVIKRFIKKEVEDDDLSDI